MSWTISVFPESYTRVEHVHYGPLGEPGTLTERSELAVTDSSGITHPLMSRELNGEIVWYYEGGFEPAELPFIPETSVVRYEQVAWRAINYSPSGTHTHGGQAETIEGAVQAARDFIATTDPEVTDITLIDGA